MTEDTLIPGNKEVLALISFTNDGSIVSHTAIPHNLPEPNVKELVRIFVASLSVSEALLASSEEATHNGSHGSSHPSRPTQKATQVLLENNTRFIAMLSPESRNCWLGIIASRIVLNDTDVCDALLPALWDAANNLVLGSAQTGAKVFSLWKSMWQLTKSNFWSDEKPVVHIKKALISLAETRVYKPPQHTNGSHSQTARVADRLPYAVGHFQGTIYGVSGEVACSFCVISPNMLLACVHGQTNEQSDSILWYYAQILGAGSRASRRFVFESSENGMVRLWYKWGGWTLCTQFISQKPALERQYQSVGDAATHILRIFSEHANP